MNDRIDFDCAEIASEVCNIYYERIETLRKMALEKYAVPFANISDPERLLYMSIKKLSPNSLRLLVESIANAIWCELNNVKL